MAISNYWGGLVPLNVYGGYAPAREEKTTDTVGVTSGLREAFIKQKINIKYPRSAAGFVMVGQCPRRNGPGKGRSPAAARAPLSGPGCEGWQLLPAASSFS